MLLAIRRIMKWFRLKDIGIIRMEWVGIGIGRVLNVFSLDEFLLENGFVLL